MQLAAYVPEYVAVHEVPKHRRGEDGLGPELSDLVDPLNSDLKDYFRDKICETLVEKGHQVVAAPDTTSMVPEAITKLLSEKHDLLTCSRELAVALYNTQSGSNNAGLLIALSGRIGDAPALAVLKLERLQGVRVVSETTSSGQRHFNMSHLRDLMLNERTRVFKAGVFTLGARGAVEGVVSDEQRGSRQEEVATFFLNRFLGCELRVSPKAATKAFFNTAVDWINVRVEDPEDKTKYLFAVMAELNSEQRDLDPSEFARRSLDVNDRESFCITWLLTTHRPQFLRRMSRWSKHSYEVCASTSRTTSSCSYRRDKLTRCLSMPKQSRQQRQLPSKVRSRAFGVDSPGATGSEHVPATPRSATSFTGA